MTASLYAFTRETRALKTSTSMPAGSSMSLIESQYHDSLLESLDSTVLIGTRDLA